MAYSRVANELTKLRLELAVQQTLEVLHLVHHLIRSLSRNTDPNTPQNQIFHLNNIRALITDEQTALSLLKRQT